MLHRLLLGLGLQRGTRGELGVGMTHRDNFHRGGSFIKRSQLISNFYDFCVCDSVDWDKDRIGVLGTVM